MNSVSAGPSRPCRDPATQLSYLCILLTAINETCKVIAGVAYGSGGSKSDNALTEFQVFLGKLSQVCDSQKGGNTVTALVCLRADNSPQYLFCSNYRKTAELEQTRVYLSNLLQYVGLNPDNLQPRPLQKQVLWRILEFNFQKVEFYLETLITAIAGCIGDCELRGESSGQCCK